MAFRVYFQLLVKTFCDLTHSWLSKPLLYSILQCAGHAEYTVLYTFMPPCLCLPGCSLGYSGAVFSVGRSFPFLKFISVKPSLPTLLPTESFLFLQGTLYYYLAFMSFISPVTWNTGSKHSLRFPQPPLPSRRRHLSPGPQSPFMPCQQNLLHSLSWVEPRLNKALRASTPNPLSSVISPL